MDNIFSILKASAEKYPQKVYVVDKDVEFTYSEVYQKVHALARYIENGNKVKENKDIDGIDERSIDRGYLNYSYINKNEIRQCGIDRTNTACCKINCGDRILIYLDNSVHYIMAFFSALLLNAIVVPINKNTTIENLKFIVQDTSPKAIISNTTFLNKLQKNVDFGTCQFINMDLVSQDYCNSSSGSSSNNNSSVGSGSNSGNSNYSSFCAKESESINLINELGTDSDLPAMILYTSGTTRMPKGVTLTHKNLITNTESILSYLKLTSEDSILATINFSYSYGNSIFLTHTKVGAKIAIENRIAYPMKIIETMSQSKATGFSTVGSYINLLLKQEDLKKNHLKHLRYITFAGESTSMQDIIKLNELAPHIKVYVMYGQTEASARLSYLEPLRIFEKAGSIGKGLNGVTLRVVREDGTDVSPSEIGEIIAYGANIMKGYWNNEMETNAVIKNGWLYTGDLATVDEEGFIYVKGRKDDMIKYLGHRISPLEIEAVINSCEQVLESAVVGIGKDSGKQIKAYVIPKYGVKETEEIADYIRKLLPSFKRPQLIEFVDEIPRTANGKIKRSELRDINS